MRAWEETDKACIVLVIWVVFASVCTEGHHVKTCDALEHWQGYWAVVGTVICDHHTSCEAKPGPKSIFGEFVRWLTCLQTNVVKELKARWFTSINQPGTASDALTWCSLKDKTKTQFKDLNLRETDSLDPFALQQQGTRSVLCLQTFSSARWVKPHRGKPKDLHLSLGFSEVILMSGFSWQPWHTLDKSNFELFNDCPNSVSLINSDDKPQVALFLYSIAHQPH